MISRAFLAAAALTGAAAAQEAPPSQGASPGCAPQPTCTVTPVETARDRLAYDTAFFSQFNPQTALDMVNQTPGFSLDGGDDRRGFSGAVGNVLIDGHRPSAKSQSIEDILAQIPVSQVVRVELLRGAAVAGDASGQSMLVNVIRTPSAGSGRWRASAEIYGGRASPRGGGSYAGRIGQFEYGFGGSFHTQYRTQPGWRLLTDTSGALTERVDTPSPREFEEYLLNGNFVNPLWGGRLSVTGEARRWSFQADNGFFFFDPSDAPTRSFTSDFDEGQRSYEVGFDYDRDFGPWSWALVGLATRRSYESEEAVINRNAAGLATSTVDQAVRQDSGETILRTSLARGFGAHRIEFGIEGAFNSLDQELDFIANPVLPPIPNSNVLIEEERAELFGSHSWRPNDRWTVETRLAWETSTLTFTGDTDQSVEFKFWKPSVQLSRAFGDDNQVRFRVYRDVGQLDFGDFTSAAAIADGLIAGGNPDLAPQTDWRYELGADLRFPGGAALGLTLTRHNYTDIADVVLIRAPNPPEPDILFDAPGNIGDAEATSLEANLTLPLTALLPRSRVTIAGELWDTEVVDPVTGAPRIISNLAESELDIDFRQDLSAFSWGVSYYKRGETQAYRFNEIDTSEEGPWVDVWLEKPLWGGTRLRAVAANVAGGSINRDRRFFTPDRSGVFERRDLRERTFGTAPWFLLELSGTF
jgi:hypothetical protein